MGAQVNQSTDLLSDPEIIALRDGRRRQRTRGRTGAGLWISLAIIIVSAGVMMPLSFEGLRTTVIVFMAPPPITIKVTMSGRTISPPEIRVPIGSSVRIEVENLDGPRDGHRLKTTGQVYDADIAVWGGVTKGDVFLPARQPGRFSVICAIRGHASEGMVATLIVE